MDESSPGGAAVNGGQATQVLLTAKKCNGQSWHARKELAARVALYVPAAQDRQVVLAIPVEYVPAGQD